MSGTAIPFDAKTALAQLESAGRENLLSPGAIKNIRDWLTEPRYSEYAPQVAEHLAQRRFQQLDDVFWTIIPFGTGGRRGKMYPIGSNAVNDRTIGESAQGLADYVNKTIGGSKLSCAIAYDTRHRSRDFAELCAEVMVANGFEVYFLDGFRSTPELSFLVRYKQCSCGIMVTASHNPPSDNAVKVYWSTGGQLLPPHDRGVIDCVMSATTIQRVPFATAVSDGKVHLCQDEVDRAFITAVQAQGFSGPRGVKNPIFAAARSWRHGGAAGAGGRRISRCRSFCPARHPGRRFSKRAQPRRQSGEQGGVRLDHRARPRIRRRCNPGQRSRLRSSGTGRAGHRQTEFRLGDDDRQSDRRAADRVSARMLEKGRKADARALHC